MTNPGQVAILLLLINYLLLLPLCVGILSLVLVLRYTVKPV